MERGGKRSRQGGREVRRQGEAYAANKLLVEVELVLRLNLLDYVEDFDSFGHDLWTAVVSAEDDDVEGRHFGDERR